MAVISWNGASNLDLKILGQTFDFRSDVLQVSDPSIQANQFDLVENGTDLVLVKSRDATGAPLAAADVRYAYIPNMIIRQVGGTDSSPVSSNIVLSNGGQLYVGDRITDTLLDDAGNDATALSTQLQSVQVWGLGGADTITTGDGNDRVYGNTGADSISGGAGNDSIYGGQENDTVSGGGGNDQVAGDIGNDQVNGGSGNDVLYGGAGNDVIDPDTGNDTIFAGNGNDTVSIGNSDTGNKLVYMDKLQDQVNIISTTGDHTVYLGENNDQAFLEANSGDIQVFGDSGNDTIYAQNSGSDTLDGGNDNDRLRIQNGSVGKKTLIGGFGDDNLRSFDQSGDASDQILPNTQITMDGGEGDDTLSYAIFEDDLGVDVDQDDTIESTYNGFVTGRGLFITDANNGGDDNDIIAFGAQTILTLRDKSIENIETINWSNDSDEVIFADGNNTKTAGTSVLVNGNGGEDYLDASRETSSSYTLNGNRDSDTLIGGAGADRLRGGQGEDLLKGNAGADTFQYLENWNGSSNYSDVIQDFTGTVDKMAFNGNAFSDVSAIDGYKGTAGDSTTANDNLLIATGDSYSIGNFDTFLSVGAADTDKPGFYIFFNSSTNRGEIWFDTSMVSTSNAVLIATFNNITAVNQLAQFNEGPAGNNSGDFVIV